MIGRSNFARERLSRSTAEYAKKSATSRASQTCTCLPMRPEYLGSFRAITRLTTPLLCTTMLRISIASTATSRSSRLKKRSSPIWRSTSDASSRIPLYASLLTCPSASARMSSGSSISVRRHFHNTLESARCHTCFRSKASTISVSNGKTTAPPNSFSALGEVDGMPHSSRRGDEDRGRVVQLACN
jgi:hypothetical protein